MYVVRAPDKYGSIPNCYGNKYHYITVELKLNTARVDFKSSNVFFCNANALTETNVDLRNM